MAVLVEGIDCLISSLNSICFYDLRVYFMWPREAGWDTEILCAVALSVLNVFPIAWGHLPAL